MKNFKAITITVIIMALLSVSSCSMERQLTGKEYVAKQQKEMMWKGYKKRK